MNNPLAQRTKGARAFFEVFLSKSPLRVGFDLEYEFARPEHAGTAERVLGEARDKEKFPRPLLVDRLLPWLSKLAGFEITTADCGCLDESNAEMLSFHVVVDTVFIPKCGLPQFVAAIQDEFKPTLSPLLDVGVYNSRPFRLAGCSKVGGKRDLLPVSRVGDVQFGAIPPIRHIQKKNKKIPLLLSLLSRPSVTSDPNFFVVDEKFFVSELTEQMKR